MSTRRCVIDALTNRVVQQTGEYLGAVKPRLPQGNDLCSFWMFESARWTNQMMLIKEFLHLCQRTKKEQAMAKLSLLIFSSSIVDGRSQISLTDLVKIDGSQWEESALECIAPCEPILFISSTIITMISLLRKREGKIVLDWFSWEWGQLSKEFLHGANGWLDDGLTTVWPASVLIVLRHNLERRWSAWG